MIESIAAISWMPAVQETSAPTATGTADFSRLVDGGLGKLNAEINAGDGALRAMAAGKDVPVHDVMIAMEQARIDLQFAVEVRNRVVEAYQQLTQMQL
jgi:flagellar hook-basal body complex protein FliE